jgi:peptide/nickel transport system substrate-binding protein
MAEPSMAMAEVNPGKLTIMVGDLGNERFDTVFVGGTPGWQNYSQIIHGVLLNSNEERELIPGIATDWGLSADGLTWTFNIREGVKWHDGSELTPEDVLWTFQHTLNPESKEYSISTTAIRMAGILNKIELSGPNEMVLTTTRPELLIETYASDTTPGYFPIMPKRATLHDNEEEVAYDNNPIGAGFMSLVSQTPASRMNFERFDDYYYQPNNGFPEDKRVSFQLLDLLLVPEESTRVAAIRAEEADLAPVSLQTKNQVESGGGRLVFSPEGVVSQPGLYGCWEPQYPCHDKRVRQALDYAIDKELIRDTLYGGPEVFQLKGWMDVSPSTIGYTPELDPWPFDPDKARQLLADAGYPGGEGFGKFIVNVRAPSALPLMLETAQVVGDMWQRELGLEVEIRLLESQDIKARRLAGELHGQVYWEENDTRRSNLNTVAGSYGDAQRETPWHKDPELFALAQEVVQILDSEEREEPLKELLQRFREETYHIGIGYANTPWAVGPRVLTWQPYPLTLYPSALHSITLK